LLTDKHADASLVSQQLLLNVADQLKIPLLQIARRAEQGQHSGTADLLGIQTTADAALQLLDSYALGVRLSLEPQLMQIEPVSVPSVLYDTGQALDALAKNYGVALELNISGRHGPVMAHREGLQAALVSLGSALIEALPALEGPQLTLQLATHRSRYGIVAGLYADTKQFTSKTLQKGRLLQATSRQPLLDLTHTSGAGIFVADAILQAMDLNLTASRHSGLHGFGTVLQPNFQMQLV
jgi:hypothetical protein